VNPILALPPPLPLKLFVSSQLFVLLTEADAMNDGLSLYIKLSLNDSLSVNKGLPFNIPLADIGELFTKTVPVNT
jgi:hypothetical protein